MKKNIHSNIIALGIGFSLIIIIAGIAFFKSNDLKSSTENDSASSLVNAITENIQKANKVSSDVLVQKIMNPQSNVMIIDIRDADDFAKEHIIGSQNIPFLMLPEIMTSLDKNKPYTLVDYGLSIELVAMAIKNMTEIGFSDISYLDGGFVTWKEGYNPIISAGNPNLFTDQSKVTYIQIDQLKEILQAEKKITLIDVRKNNEFVQGHIESAINIYLDDIEKNKNLISSDKEIIVYGENGLQSFQAAVRLFDMGFFNVFALADGLNVWQDKNYALTK